MVSLKLLLIATLSAVAFGHHRYHVLDSEVDFGRGTKNKLEGEGGLLRSLTGRRSNRWSHGGSSEESPELEELWPERSDGGSNHGRWVRGDSRGSRGVGSRRLIWPGGDRGGHRDSFRRIPIIGGHRVAYNRRRLGGNRLGYHKLGVLNSFGFIRNGVQGLTARVFSDLYRRGPAQRPSDAIDVYITAAIGLTPIINSWGPGLGDLFSSSFLATAKINLCLNGDDGILSNGRGSICDDDYGSQWGLKHLKGSRYFKNAGDYIRAYGLENCRDKFDGLIKRHARHGIHGLKGSVKVVVHAIKGLVSLVSRNGNSWNRKDLSIAIAKVITIAGAIGNSYHRKVGNYIVDDLWKYSAKFAKHDEGFIIRSDDIKSIINIANIHNWNDLVDNSSDEQFESYFNNDNDSNDVDDDDSNENISDQHSKTDTPLYRPFEHSSTRDVNIYLYEENDDDLHENDDDDENEDLVDDNSQTYTKNDGQGNYRKSNGKDITDYTKKQENIIYRKGNKYSKEDPGKYDIFEDDDWEESQRYITPDKSGNNGDTERRNIDTYRNKKNNNINTKDDFSHERQEDEIDTDNKGKPSDKYINDKRGEKYRNKDGIGKKGTNGGPNNHGSDKGNIKDKVSNNRQDTVNKGWSGTRNINDKEAENNHNDDEAGKQGTNGGSNYHGSDKDNTKNKLNNDRQHNENKGWSGAEDIIDKNSEISSNHEGIEKQGTNGGSNSHGSDKDNTKDKLNNDRKHDGRDNENKGWSDVKDINDKNRENNRYRHDFRKQGINSGSNNHGSDENNTRDKLNNDRKHDGRDTENMGWSDVKDINDKKGKNNRNHDELGKQGVNGGSNNHDTDKYNTKDKVSNHRKHAGPDTENKGWSGAKDVNDKKDENNHNHDGVEKQGTNGGSNNHDSVKSNIKDKVSNDRKHDERDTENEGCSDAKKVNDKKDENNRNHDGAGKRGTNGGINNRGSDKDNTKDKISNEIKHDGRDTENKGWSGAKDINDKRGINNNHDEFGKQGTNGGFNNHGSDKENTKDKVNKDKQHNENKGLSGAEDIIDKNGEILRNHEGIEKQGTNGGSYNHGSEKNKSKDELNNDRKHDGQDNENKVWSDAKDINDKKGEDNRNRHELGKQGINSGSNNHGSDKNNTKDKLNNDRKHDGRDTENKGWSDAKDINDKKSRNSRNHDRDEKQGINSGSNNCDSDANNTKDKVRNDKNPDGQDTEHKGSAAKDVNDKKHDNNCNRNGVEKQGINGGSNNHDCDRGNTKDKVSNDRKHDQRDTEKKEWSGTKHIIDKKGENDHCNDGVGKQGTHGGSKNHVNDKDKVNNDRKHDGDDTKNKGWLGAEDINVKKVKNNCSYDGVGKRDTNGGSNNHGSDKDSVSNDKKRNGQDTASKEWSGGKDINIIHDGRDIENKEWSEGKNNNDKIDGSNSSSNGVEKHDSKIVKDNIKDNNISDWQSYSDHNKINDNDKDDNDGNNRSSEKIIHGHRYYQIRGGDSQNYDVEKIKGISNSRDKNTSSIKTESNSLTKSGKNHGLHQNKIDKNNTLKHYNKHDQLNVNQSKNIRYDSLLSSGIRRKSDGNNSQNKIKNNSEGGHNSETIINNVRKKNIGDSKDHAQDRDVDSNFQTKPQNIATKVTTRSERDHSNKKNNIENDTQDNASNNSRTNNARQREVRNKNIINTEKTKGNNSHGRQEKNDTKTVEGDNTKKQGNSDANISNTEKSSDGGYYSNLNKRRSINSSASKDKTFYYYIKLNKAKIDNGSENNKDNINTIRNQAENVNNNVRRSNESESISSTTTESSKLTQLGSSQTSDKNDNTNGSSEPNSSGNSEHGNRSGGSDGNSEIINNERNSKDGREIINNNGKNNSQNNGSKNIGIEMVR